MSCLIDEWRRWELWRSLFIWFLPFSFMFISSIKPPIDWNFCIKIFLAGSCASHVLTLTLKNLFIVQFPSLLWRLGQAFLLWCLLARLQPAHPVELNYGILGLGLPRCTSSLPSPDNCDLSECWDLILLKKRGNGFQTVLDYHQSNKELEQKYFSALQLWIFLLRPYFSHIPQPVIIWIFWILSIINKIKGFYICKRISFLLLRGRGQLFFF